MTLNDFEEKIGEKQVYITMYSPDNNSGTEDDYFTRLDELEIDFASKYLSEEFTLIEFKKGYDDESLNTDQIIVLG